MWVFFVISKFLVAASAYALSTTTAAPKLRSKYKWVPPAEWERNVSTKELEADLEDALKGVLGLAHSEMQEELVSIENALWPTFEALPKKSGGRLSDRAASYLAHRYFMKVYGWHISGLGVQSNGMTHSVAAVHEANVLQEKVPGVVEALLESRAAGRGLTLSDVAAMVATLHRLILSDNGFLLQIAYQFSSIDITHNVDEQELNSALLSFSTIRTRGFNGTGPYGFQLHQKQKSKPSSNIAFFTTLATDIARNIAYQHRHQANPFIPLRWSFDSLLESVEMAVEKYGPWQDLECHEMKEHLMRLDPLRSGRVGLAAFYDQNKTLNYSFAESYEYLEHIGALDLSGDDGPKVIVSNYMLGKANCYATSTYYTYCCLNECDGLMHEVESQIQGSTASPESILALASNFSTTTVDGPREVSEALADKLSIIAKRHGGKVPIHGRLFAQWLHFMFPHECPYPHTGPASAAVTSSQWLDGGPAGANATSGLRAVEASLSHWDDEELLPLHDDAGGGPRGAVLVALRGVAMVAAIAAVCRSLYASWRGCAQSLPSYSSGEAKKHMF